MVLNLIITIALLLALMTGWILVQRAARAVAEQHPEAGPLRLIGGGCGGHGHGHDAAPSPLMTSLAPKPIVSKPVMAKAIAKVSDQGCASCTNTACKPATLDTAAFAGALHFQPAE